MTVFTQTVAARRLTFGVIITCHNYARYVGQAIDSVLAQTRRADEIIVVDDGSTDGSRAVISAYGGAIRTRFQPNAGHVAACNAGFALSHADVILFLDADDRLCPDALQEVERLWTPGATPIWSSSRAPIHVRLKDSRRRSTA